MGSLTQSSLGFLSLKLCFAASLFLTTIGCDSNEESKLSKNSNGPTISDKNRPPLRIVLVDQPSEMESILRQRWGSVSDQGLKFELKTASELSLANDLRCDVCICECRLIGQLAERELISNLPPELADVLEPTGRDAATVKLPATWLRSVSYGKQVYGLPLGCSPLLFQFIGADRQASEANVDEKLLPLVELDWSSVRFSRPDSKPPRLEEGAISIDLVDQFLAVACTQRERSYDPSLLFQAVDFGSRLNEPWAIESARLLATLHRRSPSDADIVLVGPDEVVLADAAIEDQFSKAWYVPKYNSEDFAMEKSSQNEQAKFGSDDFELNKVALVDAGHSPAAFISSRTRQSGKSIFFIRWLNELPQRAALARVSPWIQPLDAAAKSTPIQNTTFRESYQRYALRSAEATDFSRFFQFNGGQEYRTVLLNTLTRIVDSSDRQTIEAMMNACAKSWDQLTESIGRDSQQQSLERALQLRD